MSGRLSKAEALRVSAARQHGVPSEYGAGSASHILSASTTGGHTDSAEDSSRGRNSPRDATGTSALIGLRTDM